MEESSAQKCLVVYDLDALRGSFDACKRSFAPHFLHCLAIKSAPMAFVIDEALNASMGIEAASFGEASSAIARGADPARVLFDSPAKTVPE